jgi:hypothetical protein
MAPLNERSGKLNLRSGMTCEATVVSDKINIIDKARPNKINLLFTLISLNSFAAGYSIKSDWFII